MEVYHGTTENGAESLRENGIRKERLQSRDKGFFGDGFYLTEYKDNAYHHAETVASKRDSTPEVMSVEIQDNADVFYPGDWEKIYPEEPPEWHDEFMSWVVDTLDEASVWEEIPGVTRDRIISNGKEERTPGSDEFNHEKWLCDVTRFAKEQGCDIVWWNPTEIIVVNIDNPPITF